MGPSHIANVEIKFVEEISVARTMFLIHFLGNHFIMRSSVSYQNEIQAELL